MARTRVLITVKTYPTFSSKYSELVCTAGFLEDGSWIRIYPIKFRDLDYLNRYKKYQWIEIDLVKNESDFRKESYRPVSIYEQPILQEVVDTKENWSRRKELVLKSVYTDLARLLQEAKSKTNPTSLAVFKPTKILKFYYKECEREWSADKLEALKQQNLFESSEGKTQIVRKLPYNFYYTFEDENGKTSSLMVEDWEIGALYWNALRDTAGNEIAACEKVKQKYFDQFLKKNDLYFFLGTRLKEHAKGYPNPFSIIGLFYPLKETVKKVSHSPQLQLFRS